MAALGLGTIGAKLIAGGLLLLAIVGGIVAFIAYERAVGAENQRDKQEAADDAWMNGAVKNADQVQSYWRDYLAGLDKQEKTRAQQKTEAVRLSAGNDQKLCLDPVAGDRLRARGTLQSSRAGGLAAPGNAAAGGARR